MKQRRHALVITVLCLSLFFWKGAAQAAPLPLDIFDAARRGLLVLPEYQEQASQLASEVTKSVGFLSRLIASDVFRATVLSVFVNNSQWSRSLQVKTLVPTQVTETDAILRGIITNIPDSIRPNAATSVTRAFDLDTGERKPLRVLVASSSKGAGDAFEVSITGLVCNTTYTYRAVLAHKDGLTKGYNQSFKTAQCR